MTTEDRRTRRLRELLDAVVIAENTLRDVESIGWAPAVDPKGWAKELRVHLEEARLAADSDDRADRSERG
jgi:hypothetical protein